MKTRNRSVRLTRRSFRRKLVMFGVAIFASLAITATGFAAWVLSTDAMKEEAGGVELGSVSDAGVEIENLTFLDDDGSAPIKNFVFEPAAGDVEGRVRADEKGNVEDMDIRIGWTIKNYQNVAETNIEFKIPQSIQDAINKNYIALPAEFVQRVEGSASTPVTEVTDDGTYYIYDFTVSEEINASNSKGDLSWTVETSGALEDVTFTLNLKFNWGEKFGNMNPSLYYDNPHEEGAKVPYRDVKKTLLDLKKTVLGIEDTAENREAAVAKIANEELKAEAATKQTLIEVLELMSAEEQDAFYAGKTVSYKLVVHAIVN